MLASAKAFPFERTSYRSQDNVGCVGGSLLHRADSSVKSALPHSLERIHSSELPSWHHQRWHDLYFAIEEVSHLIDLITFGVDRASSSHQ